MFVELIVVIGLASTSLASYPDPKPVPPGPNPYDPCLTKQCPRNTICRLRPLSNCTENCELFAQCVSKSDACTGRNEELKECGSACEPKCGQQNTICTLQCLINVCQCKKGYYRNSDGVCVTKDECDKPQALLSCANMLCAPGNVCRDDPTICKKAPCPRTNGRCVPAGDSESTYDACATTECATGLRCVLQQVHCIRAPCHPIAACVADSPVHNSPSPNPCELVDCAPNMRCVAQQVQCFVPPCNPIAVCVAEGTKKQCGKNEFFDECTGCEGTCEIRDIGCPAICRSPGACRCNPGFLRHNGSCIPENSCPLKY